MGAEAIFVTSEETLLRLLDSLFEPRQAAWWDGFFSDRAKPCPFFVEHPDECLIRHFDTTNMTVGRVMELGCGHGRNTLYFSSQGCRVDAVDFSESALAWAKERAARSGLKVNFIHRSIFALEPEPETYDIVYDSGCFHHLPPHRRMSYVQLVTRALKPQGKFGLVCFTPEGGTVLSDREVYELRSLKGGLAYTQSQLESIFSPCFEILDFRRMTEMSPDSGVFGKDFLWTVFMRRRSYERER